MADDTVEIHWNELRVGDVQVAPDGRTRTVTGVAEAPGDNWVTFDHGTPLTDGGRVTIHTRASSG